MYKKGIIAISPLIVFVCLYLVTSIVAGDFYKMPITVAFMIASIYAVIIGGGIPLVKRIDIFSRGAGTSNMMLMLWIFVLAGAFANTAKTMGSGTLDVFATPALVALAEKTCWQSVAPALEAGSGTVGTKLELEHTAPTPVGMTVTCHSELVAVEGRKLTFKVTLADEKGPVGGGTHERFVIFEEKFAAKAEAKKG